MVEVEIKVYIPGGKEMADLEFNEFFKNYEDNKKKWFKQVGSEKVELKKKAIDYYMIDKRDKKVYKQLELEIPSFEVIPIFDVRVNRYQYKIRYYWGYDNYTVFTRRDLYRQLRKKHKNIHPYLLRLLTDYFYEVCFERNNHFENNKLIGWKTEYRKNGSKIAEYSCGRSFNEIKMMFFYLKPDYLNSDKISILLELLSESCELTSIFSYGLLSVSLKVKKDYEELNAYLKNLYGYTEMEYQCNSIEPFCLCLHGTNTISDMTKKKIASAFLDYSKQTLEYPNKVCDHMPHASLESFDRKIKETCVFADCPIILKSQANKETIPSNAQKVGKIEKLQLGKIIKGFPVFLSKNPMHRDNVFNADISLVPQFDYKTISVIVENVIFDFIQFITNKYNTADYDNIPQCFKDAFRKYSKIFYQDKYNTIVAKQCRDLMVALHQFGLFLNEFDSNSIPQVDKIIEQQLQFYLDLALDCEYKEEQERNQSTSSTRTNIKREFYNIVSIIREQSPESIITNSEEVYIEYSAFQKAYGPGYKSFLKKCRPSIISAPVRPNTNQYRGFTYSKMICGQKINVLVVKASQYNRYCHKK